MFLMSLLFSLTLQAQDIPTFRGNNNHSGAISSSLSKEQIKSLSLKNFDLAHKGTYAQPLYLKKVTSLPQKSHKGFLLFGSQEKNKKHIGKGFFHLYDLEEEKEVWKTNLPGFPLNAPVYSPDLQRFYVLSVAYYEGHMDFVTKRGQPSYSRHYLSEINTKGKILKTLEIDLDKYFNYPKEKSIELRINCRTGLTLTMVAKQPYLFFGCSSRQKVGSQKELKYYGFKNVRGLFFKVPLSKEGSLPSLKDLFHFSANPPRKNKPWSGFETGIWMLGAAPSTFDDQYALLNTGNGPYKPKESTFGCSVLKLNLKTMQIEDSFSLDHPQNNECISHNTMDMSGTGLALGEFNGKKIVSGIHKMGRLYILDYDNLNNHVVLNIGDPTTWSSTTLGNSLYYAAQSSPGQQDSYLYWNSLSPIPKEDIEILNCFGAIKKDQGTPLDLFFSGSIRNQYIALSKKDPLHHEIQRFNSSFLTATKIHPHVFKKPFSPFRKVGTLGFLSSHQKKKYKDWQWHEFPRSEISEADISPKMKKPTPRFYLAPHDSKKNCPPPPKGFLPLYSAKLKQKQRKERGLVFGKVNINFNNEGAIKASKTFEKVFGYKNFRTPARAHPLLIQDEKGEDKFLLFGILREGSKKETLLLFVDAQNGEVIKEIIIEGQFYFNWPVLTENSLFIATKKHGIKRLTF